MFTHRNRPRPTSAESGTLLAGLRERRQARAAYRALEADLAAYTTDADVNDLLELLSDQEGVEAEQMRTILTGNLAHHSRSTAA